MKHKCVKCIDLIACPPTCVCLSFTGTDATSLVDLGYNLSDRHIDLIGLMHLK